MDAQWHIELLGGLTLRHKDRVITRFRTRKAGALLGYLAYHLPQRHPREGLIDVLWPDQSLKAGRNSFRVAISSLRRQLEPPGVPAGSVLAGDRFYLQLNPAAVTTDAAEFQAALRAAEQAGSVAERTQHLRDAVELYQGELLAGYYEEWILSERRRLADLFYQAMEHLTEHLKAAGDIETALAYAHRAVQADPLREEAHRDLMRLLAASGQPLTALRQYQELCRIIQEELDATPGAATDVLARQIEHQAATGEGTSGISPQTGSGTAPSGIPSSLPTGTITFLLTDIEGSMALQERVGEAFRETRAGHNVLLRQEILRHGGAEAQEAEGAFVIAFAHASDGIACAVAAQQALAVHEWPQEVGSLRVRMALDTREAEVKNGGYPVDVLRRAHRMLLAGHGGQILCSEETAVLLRRALKEGLRLKDLGVYRLHNGDTLERLFMVEYPDMPLQEFPPLSARPGHPGRLPLTLTRFFGREEEIARLEEMLSKEDRLVTLSGPPGSGKTRLAVEAARKLAERLHGAVWFVPLADISDPGLIVDAVLEGLGVTRFPRTEPLEQVVEVLSRQPSLLVLDNFEHLVTGGAATVRKLLERLPALQCLVTSRQRLNLTGEREFQVLPLPTPRKEEKPESLMGYPGVQLFVDRAQAVRPDFQVTAANAAVVAALCDRLEGIPLALELAAARALVMTPARMLAGLEHRFDFLTGRQRDAETRHQTLKAAVEWSYRLLTPELQRFFARLSVFRGGWTVEAAEAICEEPSSFESLTHLYASR